MGGFSRSRALRSCYQNRTLRRRRSISHVLIALFPWILWPIIIRQVIWEGSGSALVGLAVLKDGQ